MNLSALIPNNDKRFTVHTLNDVITRLSQLALMSNEEPLPGKNHGLFLGINVWRNKIFLRQRFWNIRTRLYGSAKCSCSRFYLNRHPAMLDFAFTGVNDACRPIAS
jgi:hypothetical protein